MNRIRRGTALIVVLVVVVILALAAYGFLFVMRSENEASRFELDADQARAAAMSGAESVLAWVELPRATRLAARTEGTSGASGGDTRRAPFQAMDLETDVAQQRGVASELDAEPTWSFSVLAARGEQQASRDPLATVSLGATGAPTIRFGIDDEAAKLDVRLLAQWEEQKPGHARWVLEELWELAPDDVAAILRAIGLDAAPASGASRSGQPPEPTASAPVDTGPSFSLPTDDASSANDPPDPSVDGVAPAVIVADQSKSPSTAVDPSTLSRRLQAEIGAERWWGGDWDRNGRVETWEASRFAAAAAGMRRSDTSADPNAMGQMTNGTTPWGTGPDVAVGVTNERDSLLIESPADALSPRDQPLRNWLTCYAAERNERFDGRARVWLNEPDAERLAGALREEWPDEWVRFVLAYRRFGPSENVDESTVVPATDPSVAAWQPKPGDELSVEIADPLDLIDARVTIPANELSDEAVVMASPFPAEGVELPRVARALFDETCVDQSPVRSARISLGTAPALVLEAIPGWDSETVQRIIEARERSVGDPQSRQSVGWIWSEGLVDLTTMKAVHSYLTLEGDVASGQVVGFRDDQSPVYRFTAVFDGSRGGAVLLEPQTWHSWGRGFTAQELRGQATESPLNQNSSLSGTAP